MILELKVDATPEEAIQQIKEKQYDLKLRGRLGEDKENKILAVGISYDKKSKNHKSGCLLYTSPSLRDA